MNDVCTLAQQFDAVYAMMFAGFVFAMMGLALISAAKLLRGP
jgi:hypothetical protein